MDILREMIWVGSTLKDLKTFPSEVKDEIGFALHRVQEGKTPENSKPLKGIGAGVMEIVCNFDTNTYRSVYMVKLNEVVYVLHCFQKKSKSGIKTPKKEIELVEKRLKMAKLIASGRGLI